MFISSLFQPQPDRHAVREFLEEPIVPCFLFTYHAYGSWLPDRLRGYVKRGQGILAPDKHMYRLYSEAMTQSVVCFVDDVQQELIREVLAASRHQSFESYYIATDSTHLHVLLGWRDKRRATIRRGQLRWSLTRVLNLTFEKREWFAEGGSCKQVKDRQHFDYLRNIYLPKHYGWKWHPDLGMHK